MFLVHAVLALVAAGRPLPVYAGQSLMDLSCLAADHPAMKMMSFDAHTWMVRSALRKARLDVGRSPEVLVPRRRQIGCSAPCAESCGAQSSQSAACAPLPLPLSSLTDPNEWAFPSMCAPRNTQIFTFPKGGQRPTEPASVKMIARLFDEACQRQKVDHAGDADRHQPGERHSPVEPTGHCFLLLNRSATARSLLRRKERVNCQKSFRWSRGSDLRLLRLTTNGLPDRTSGERPRASRIVRVRRLDLMKLGPFAGKIRTDSWRGPDLFC
jgi:hypothetical protein